MTEIIRIQYEAKVISPNGLLIMRVEAPTPQTLDDELGDKLSEFTLEEGGDVPHESKVDLFQFRKVGPLKVGRSLLESKPL
ncbi:MAG: hypothetical protein UU12_C0031G0012 [Candidatus Woesebacteria bacterium GW2011_GWA2_40_7b]|uniref:Uncharacterized protein n=1 Tax=Candidatus Woesebacteria bacterium GW2011_GWA2_40_7b TaxID=1618563 RepID=A0A0G0SYZ0_9BACT|nr:MAG: hypothetical protein UU12_C0031G0012 [Candidatus Woesebacteria bacterium GW2011_GWA2_40_7b]